MHPSGISGSHVASGVGRACSGSLVSRAQPYLLALPALLIVAVVFSWYVTDGTFRFFEPESFGSFYDAQAISFVHGRVDVPSEAIGAEALIRNAKYYGYFGPAPALLRLPLLLLAPDLYGRWSRIMLLLGSLLALSTAVFFLVQSAPPLGDTGGLSMALVSVFVITAGIGSTNIFLASRAFPNHEAPMWGAAFALLCYFFVLRYQLSARIAWLAGAAVCCYLSFLSRISTGFGAALALALLAVLTLSEALPGGAALARLRSWFRLPPQSRPKAAGLLLLSILGVTLGSHLLMNYLKFHTVLESFPLRLHVQYTPERIAKIKGTLVHPSYFLSIARCYVTPAVEFRDSFPWIYMGLPAGEIGAKMDIAELFAGLPCSMPGLVLLSVLGTWQIWFSKSEAFRAVRLISLAALGAGSVLFVTAAISQRYLHDFFPFLIITGAVGLRWLHGRMNPLLKCALLVLFVCTAAFSVAANLSFTLAYQREQIWGVPQEYRARFAALRAGVDAFFTHRPGPSAAATLSPAPDPASQRFSLVSADRLRPLHQVKVVPAGTGAVLEVSGDDAQTELAVFSLVPNRKYLIELEITPPAPTVVQFFYGSTRSAAYSESNSVRAPVRAGRNRVAIVLADRAMLGPLRFDPGTLPGTYQIHSLEVRTVD